MVFVVSPDWREYIKMYGNKLWTPYCGSAPSPAELLSRWNFDPTLLVIFALALSGCILVVLHRPHVIQSRYGLALAYVLMVILFISPFCALASALFSIRVAHHVILTSVVAPLIVFSLPLTESKGAFFSILSAAFHAMIFWAWHFPSVYGAALASDAIYWVMQFTLAGSAALLWLAVRKAPPPLAILILLVTMMQMGLLGALLTFSTAPLYAPHILTTDAWGFTTLADQQLAGVAMWFGGSCIYLVVALVMFRGILDRREPVH